MNMFQRRVLLIAVERTSEDGRPFVKSSVGALREYARRLEIGEVGSSATETVQIEDVTVVKVLHFSEWKLPL